VLHPDFAWTYNGIVGSYPDDVQHEFDSSMAKRPLQILLGMLNSNADFKGVERLLMPKAYMSSDSNDDLQPASVPKDDLQPASYLLITKSDVIASARSLDAYFVLPRLAEHLWSHRDLGWIAMQLDAFGVKYGKDQSVVSSEDANAMSKDVHSHALASSNAPFSLLTPDEIKKTRRSQDEVLDALHSIDAFVEFGLRALADKKGPFPKAVLYEPVKPANQ